MAGGSNKRVHPRYLLRFPLKYREAVSSPPLFRGAQATDISLGGLKFLTESFLPRETRIIIEFRMPDKLRLIRASSKVTWLKSLGSGYRYEVGSTFTNIKITEKDFIKLRLALLDEENAEELP